MLRVYKIGVGGEPPTEGPCEWQSLLAVGGGFGFKAETLFALPGTLAWPVVYFFLITIVVWEGGLPVYGAALRRGGVGRWRGVVCKCRQLP